MKVREFIAIVVYVSIFAVIGQLVLSNDAIGYAMWYFGLGLALTCLPSYGFDEDLVNAVGVFWFFTGAFMAFYRGWNIMAVFLLCCVIGMLVKDIMMLRKELS